MDSGGIASRLLQGGTAFTALIVMALAFMTLSGYVSSGFGAGARRPSPLLVFMVVVIAVVALGGYLFPNLAHSVVDQLNRLGGR
jgi:sterol desaturase/sphingolipid hydroxylase (fatty acid hydroxylase superfamily)